jgi:predicted DNA-binding protein
MSTLSERIPILVSPEQRERLEDVARREGKSVGAVVRDAIDAQVPRQRRSRREAMEDLFSIEAPVADWPRMKAEIIAGAIDGDPDEVLRQLRAKGQAGD